MTIRATAILLLFACPNLAMASCKSDLTAGADHFYKAQSGYNQMVEAIQRGEIACERRERFDTRMGQASKNVSRAIVAFYDATWSCQGKKTRAERNYSVAFALEQQIIALKKEIAQQC